LDYDGIIKIWKNIRLGSENL